MWLLEVFSLSALLPMGGVMSEAGCTPCFQSSSIVDVVSREKLREWPSPSRLLELPVAVRFLSL